VLSSLLAAKQVVAILHAVSAGSLPRNRQQMKDARRDKQGYDPLYAVMHMCKEGEGRGETKFIRMVNAAPYPMMLIALDYTNWMTWLDSTLTLTTLAFLVLIQHSTVTTYRHLVLPWSLMVPPVENRQL